MSGVTPNDLQDLDDISKKEVMSFLQAEHSKQKVQMSIHQFTNMCFKQCISSINNAELSSQEDLCLKNCVNRFLDTNIRVVQSLKNIQ
ncbi:protein transporter TIM8 Ecym_5155 [Eremothecium cymbalariae DBVPG|uniref:Mitochondrial import inner membrane translocase subunit n=1 Tax=Eremothecium cymbalariae (strain CBS 270.75 / DBVPG 7215 / KCTC 17166 / NRRL Y-17582) TaxID=931890 RepID=I6NCY9_ERECY|nr:hypothetical protein Ecym_5155 [Eremothecium cymbalariae DBVPG\